MGTIPQIEQFVCWLKSMKDIPVKVVIAGNHEVILEKDFYETSWKLFHQEKADHEAAVDKLRSAGNGIVYLLDESYNVDAAKILHKKWQKQKKQEKNQVSAAVTETSEDSANNESAPQPGSPVDVDPVEGESADSGSIGEDNSEVDPRQGWNQGYKIYGSPWQPEFYNWAFNVERGKLHGMDQSRITNYLFFFPFFFFFS